jgi:hypothetical protein
MAYDESSEGVTVHNKCKLPATVLYKKNRKLLLLLKIDFH